MTDFSAAAMLRLIRLGLKRQGLAAPAFAAPKSAHIPLSDKRGLIHGILVDHGPITLLRMGDAVKEAPDEPMMTALMLAKDPIDLVSRWQRLERYVHSKHRTRIVEESSDGFVLRHYAHEGDTPPWPEEDLLIFGLLIAMIEKNGAQDLKARIAGETSWSREHNKWHSTNLPTDVSTWEICWRSATQKRTAAIAPSDTDDWLMAARRALEADPGRPWGLETLAAELNTSARTLQRRLKEESSNFSALLAEVRMASAAELLGKSAQSPSEIGYACGFSDQAHFTREFKRFTAFTPSAYREQFRPIA